MWQQIVLLVIGYLACIASTSLTAIYIVNGYPTVAAVCFVVLWFNVVFVVAVHLKAMVVLRVYQVLYAIDVVLRIIQVLIRVSDYGNQNAESQAIGKHLMTAQENNATQTEWFIFGVVVGAIVEIATIALINSFIDRCKLRVDLSKFVDSV